MAAAVGLIEFTSIARALRPVMIWSRRRRWSCCVQQRLPWQVYCTDWRRYGLRTGGHGSWKACGGPYVADTLMLPSVHEQVIPAICMTNPVTARGAVGVMEFYSIASAVVAADAAAKAANVTLIEVRTGYAIGGKGFVTLTGDVGAVRAAVDAATRNAELLVQTAILPRPDPKLFEALL